RVLTGGKVIKDLFYEPTVLADVPADALIAREETFGPVASLFRFKTEEEAIRMANDTEFGLVAYFYSNDVRRCWRSEEHTSELQSRENLVCRLLLEKKNI